MKLPAIWLSIVPLVLGHQEHTEPHGLCEMLLRAPVIAERAFDIDHVEKRIDPAWVRLAHQEFQALHDRNMQEADTAWVVGKIPIRGPRVGLLVLNSSPECDHAVRYLTLHLFDGCSMLPHSFFLAEHDSHVGVYERSAHFEGDNEILVVSVNTGEPGEVGVDTVFTRTDRIRLAPTIDTVLTQTGFEIRR
ncbi:MAG: hypothetical protein KF797_07580 [Flavobacteriales bacterium]|nr:hypothetical protein [Flavobacteriales bacterium]